MQVAQTSHTELSFCMHIAQTSRLTRWCSERPSKTCAARELLRVFTPRNWECLMISCAFEYTLAQQPHRICTLATAVNHLPIYLAVNMSIIKEKTG
jgi:hypothetical protein